MQKVLVTGATGMLGGYVCTALADAPVDLHKVDRARFDLTAPQQVYEYIMAEKPDVILHLAAETNVDLCERDPQRAGVCNHLATDMVARAAAKLGAWLLYVSTSYVFGGQGGLEFNELDSPAPPNYYGRSKLLGEQAVRLICPTHHFIIRAGWMIGGGRGRDHKFVGKIIDQLEGGATEIRAVNDKFGSMTSAFQLSQFIVWSIRQRCFGTVHYASRGGVTRFMIARQVAAILGRDVRITAVRSAEFPLAAPRAEAEVMTSLYLPLLDGPQPGPWEEDLEAYIRQSF